MMKPLVVTLMATLTCWLFESANCALHEPAAEPVTVNPDEGPCALVVVTVAIPLQLSCSPKIPV